MHFICEPKKKEGKDPTSVIQIKLSNSKSHIQKKTIYREPPSFRTSVVFGIYFFYERIAFTVLLLRHNNHI